MPAERIKKDAPGVIAPPPLIYAIGLGAGFVLHNVYPIILPLPRWSTVLGGSLLVGLGVLLVAVAFRAFGRAGTNVNPYRPATALVTNGPFRLTRNPMYVSLTLIYLGVSVLLRSAWSLLLLPVILMIMQKGVIAREEAYLERKFGEDYLRYKRSVRRGI